MKNFMIDWQHVDTLELPKRHLDYLELAQNTQQFRQVRDEICRSLAPVQGGRGVDMGCGLGMAVKEKQKTILA